MIEGSVAMLSCVVSGIPFAIGRRGASCEERQIATMSRMGVELLSVEGPAGYIPGAAWTDESAVLWLGRNVAAIKSDVISHATMSGDVKAVVMIDSRWLVVSETAIEVWQEFLQVSDAMVEMPEVILDWRLNNDSVEVNLWDGRTLKVGFDRLTLSP